MYTVYIAQISQSNKLKKKSLTQRDQVFTLQSFEKNFVAAVSRTITAFFATCSSSTYKQQVSPWSTPETYNRRKIEQSPAH